MGWRAWDAYDQDAKKRWRSLPWRKRYSWRGALIFAAVAVSITVYGFSISPWSVQVTIRHILASPNCAAARTMGLAPALRGRPGYWSKHDRDDDGIACEPWPRAMH
jgi:hypothetical protein